VLRIFVPVVVPPAPPEPTVIVYVLPGVTAYPVPVRNPPAPPPPPVIVPPPPPPPITRYSTDVTPVGAVHVVVFANVSTTISVPNGGIPRGFNIREEFRSVLRKNDFVAIR
jgi:hypothetical protein